jgi:prolyl oligopeptidase
MKISVPALVAGSLLACLTLIQAQAQDQNAPPAPPVAPVRPVTDVYFGQKIVDPYRWMEDDQSPELATWMKAQATYTATQLDRLPLRATLLKRFDEISDTGVRISSIQPAGAYYFYFRRAPGENDSRVYVREREHGTERLLIDPEKLSSPGKRYTIDGFTPSSDGAYVSYRASIGGSEQGEIRVIETATGRDMGDVIDRCRFGTGWWLPGERAFLYNRLQDLPPGAPATERYQKSRVYLHTLGTASDADRAIFGYGVNPSIALEPAPLPIAFVPLGSKSVIVEVNSGVSPNSDFYVTSLEALHQQPSAIPWRRVATVNDEVSSVTVRGDDAYVLTYENAPHYKIVRTTLSQFDLAKAVTVFAGNRNNIVKGLQAARDALYVETMEGGSNRVWRMDYKTGAKQPIKLPYEGSTAMTWADQETDGVLFGLTAWTRSTAYFTYNPATQQSVDTSLAPPIAIDMSRVETTTVQVRSHDGVMVPLVILSQRGLTKNSANPTVLYGYGAYGAVTATPAFAPNYLPWLERGGVIAIAGVRGGGEYGEEWHLAGKQPTKPNTWKDFIACAEYLIREQYTSPAHLAGRGISAGGILIGRAITERPDLFAAAIDQVGLNDALRFETTTNGVPNIPEFGSVKTEAGFKALLAMDAYQHVKDGVRYPAVLLAIGINDPRVNPWFSAKMAARLQAATTSGKPVLLRVDYDAGHGLTVPRQQLNEFYADMYAFLFQQLGSPASSSSSSSSH